jgi:hypothetical protein
LRVENPAKGSGLDGDQDTVDKMVEVIRADGGNYRNVWPPATEELIKQVQEAAWTLLSRSAVTVFELTLLKDQVSGERTWRSRCRGPLTVRDDRVCDVRAVGGLGVNVVHFLAQFVSHGIGDSAGVDEDTLVRQVGQ